MAKETHLALFAGTDMQYPLHVKNGPETASIDITGWGLSWMLKRRKSDTDASAVLTKTTALATIVIAGVFNAAPAVNLQRATLTLADDDTFSLTPGVYYYEFKRTDNNFETVLAYGMFDLKRGVHR